MEKRSGVGKLGANAISRALAALLMIATTAVATHSGATDEIRQVAGHIPAAAANAVQPTAVIDRTDIELSGMSNVRDLLLSRLKYNSFGLRRPFVLPPPILPSPARKARTRRWIPSGDARYS